MENSDSTSGEITAAFVNVSDIFTQYSEIPSGGFNVLYKAQRYGKWFVLKGLKPEFRNSAVHLQLLTKEFEFGIQMSHPNIVQFFSKETVPVVGECIVMEYVDGLTLTEFLKTKPRSSVREKLARQLLQAMAYYHGLQIVHRDLKPDNILISRNGNNVKIIDFGLGDSDTSAILKQPAGSPKYMAPEQTKGDVKIDARADLYSFAQIVKLLRLGNGWRSVRLACGQENRDKRPTDATAALALLAKWRKWTVAALFLLGLLLVGGVSALVYNHVQTIESRQGTIDRGELIVMRDTLYVQDTTAANVPGTVVHDTVVQYKKAELTAEMSAFLKRESETYWNSFDKEYQKYEARIKRLLNGEAGDIQEDKKMYDALLAVYSDLCAKSVSHFDNDVAPALKHQYPNAQYVDSYDITKSYNQVTNQRIPEIVQRLTDIYLAMGQYDK